MTAGRWVVLVTAFFLDIHVRAATDVGAVVAAGTERRTVATSHGRLTLGPDALVENNPDVARMVRGTALVEGPREVATPYARFACATAACVAIIARADDAVTIDALSDGWTVRRTGDPATYAVSVGSRVIVGEVAPDGRALTEPPRALAWAPLVRQWANLYPGTADEFTAKVRAFRPVWTAAVERLTDDVAGRALAAVDRADAARIAAARAARAAAAEDAELRRLFREKNFVAP